VLVTLCIEASFGASKTLSRRLRYRLRIDAMIFTILSVMAIWTIVTILTIGNSVQLPNQIGKRSCRVSIDTIVQPWLQLVVIGGMPIILATGTDNSQFKTLFC
jgi:hypothetical protein